MQILLEVGEEAADVVGLAEVSAYSTLVGAAASARATASWSVTSTSSVVTPNRPK